jgi:thiol-disulfide isomerase/thioredoxin
LVGPGRQTDLFLFSYEERNGLRPQTRREPMVSLQAAIAAIALSGAGQTVLLDFYTEWCVPCRAMNPTVQSLMKAGYPVQRVNKDRNPTLAAKYDVQAIPCFVMLVDGREVDRVVGVSSYSRLEQMCKLAAPGGANPSLVAGGQTAAPPVPPMVSLPLPQSSMPAAAPLLANPPASPAVSPFAALPASSLPSPGAPPSSPPADAAAGVSDATLIAASVRLRVEDANGHSCGSGTIIDARDGQALILTCGHIFRDSKGQGKIEVDLFSPSGQQRVQGQMFSYTVPSLSPQASDADSRDVGLVWIRVPGPVVTAHVAPPGYRIQPGMAVVSVGCNNGNLPSAQHSQITSLNKFLGPPSIQVAGQPVEGRSGGGLFSSDGYVIGVCNAADPSDREGLFAALGSIHAELDRKNARGEDLSYIYRSPGQSAAGATATADAAALTANPAPAMPKQMPGTTELGGVTAAAAMGAAPTALAPHEQAALDEVRRYKKEGKEVIFIIRSRDNPDAKSEVFMLDNASAEFLRQLSAEGRPQEKPYPTSLEVPKPRQKLLEWPPPAK